MAKRISPRGSAARVYIAVIAAMIMVHLLNPNTVWAQDEPFDVVAYQSFLDANATLPARGLLNMHPAGTFRRATDSPFLQAFYADSVVAKMRLTPDEQDLGNTNGFFVTERLTYDSFGSALRDVYTNDLPVFISTDAVLHAIHMSYDLILQEAELQVLEPRLRELLAALHAAVPTLESRYGAIDGMGMPLKDLDVFLTIPRRLLETMPVEPIYTENEEEIQTLMGFIEEETGFVAYPLFAEECRFLDFSQFTPRGHYTDQEELTRYFQAMIWLGRTEIYLSSPETVECKASDADVQRQTVLAMLVDEALEISGTNELVDEIEEFIRLFVGESDNVTLENLRELRTLTDTDEASDVLDPGQLSTFQKTLAEQAWSMQRIQSQMLVNNRTLEPTGVQPASSFLLFGQRFVIDSYVTSSVVFDRILHEGNRVKRMVPKPLDVLFALGNNAAGQLLEPELEHFKYAPNMAAVRHLVDSYEDEFWHISLYNGWLNAIRALNPPVEAEREELPSFMQTAAWWQEKMNTQLAGWAQLRHDNLLYAKQSYTAIPLCSFPFTYVEPIPEFYQAVSVFAQDAARKFDALPQQSGNLQIESVVDYFEGLSGINDTLSVIAQKELDEVPFTEDEKTFLRRVIYDADAGCTKVLAGWYTRMFFDRPSVEKPDMVVADIHTTPADEAGTIVGWVFHVGTGPVNMAVVTAEVPGEGLIAFTGPVMSYYEHQSSNFERLTDEVWETAFEAAPSLRPDFVNVYLADSQGNAYGESTILAVSNEEPRFDDSLPATLSAAQNFPNPFSDWTNITFTIPQANIYDQVELLIYDNNGRLIDQLVDESLGAGHYSVRWDGMLPSGKKVASGIYYARLRVGTVIKTTPMARVR